jgi:hypothetical protein
MKISELLKENEHPKHKSALPTAASLNGQPEELELDDEELDGEEEDEEESEFDQDAIDAFKAKAEEVAPGVWALSPQREPGFFSVGGSFDEGAAEVAQNLDKSGEVINKVDPKSLLTYFFWDENSQDFISLSLKGIDAIWDSYKEYSSEFRPLREELTELAFEVAETDEGETGAAIKINKLLNHPSSKPLVGKPLSPEQRERIMFKKHLIRQKKFNSSDNFTDYKKHKEYENFKKHGAPGRGLR